MLRQMKVDIKVAQEMLRHSNPRTTLELYQQAITEEKREGAGTCAEGLPGIDFFLQHPKEPKFG